MPTPAQIKQWEEAQPVFASIYYRFADIMGGPSFTEIEIWRRFDRCCH